MQITRGNTPEKSGLYVAYHEFGELIKRSLAIYVDGEWIYTSSDQIVRDVVGYIGPLPVMKQEATNKH